MSATESKPTLSKYEELVSKEIYLHFTERYNQKSWLSNYPSWESLPEADKMFWFTLVKLCVFKSRERKSFKTAEKICGDDVE